MSDDDPDLTSREEIVYRALLATDSSTYYGQAQDLHARARQVVLELDEGAHQ